MMKVYGKHFAQSAVYRLKKYAPCTGSTDSLQGVRKTPTFLPVSSCNRERKYEQENIQNANVRLPERQVVHRRDLRDALSLPTTPDR